MSKRCVIYTRFSPRRNAEECQSCAWQQAECEQYASRNGLEVHRVFYDPDVSGADAYRPMLWNAIEELRKGDALLVWKWDRLARDLLLQLQIERAVASKGASVVATVGDVPGDSPQAQFMRQILGAVAELERKMISQRTSAAMLAHQRAGRLMSRHPPYGYMLDPNDPKRIVENADEKRTLKLIFECRDTGGMKYAQIARYLNAQGYLTRCGKPWTHILIRKFCMNR